MVNGHRVTNNPIRALLPQTNFTMSDLYWFLVCRGALAFEYRRGPVPHTSRKRCMRRGFMGFLRKFHTNGERRANAAVPADDDCATNRITVRPSRAPGRLPDVWDERGRAKGDRSWKAYRRTQYRPLRP